MTWKTAYRSFYYEGAPEPEDLVLDRATTALLVIDIQNKYMAVPSSTAEQKRWTPFFDRMNSVVIPNTRALIDLFRKHGIERLFARVGCLKADGRDRSLSQKKPGWNYLLMPRTSEETKYRGPVMPIKVGSRATARSARQLAKIWRSVLPPSRSTTGSRRKPARA